MNTTQMSLAAAANLNTTPMVKPPTNTQLVLIGWRTPATVSDAS
jgi:hypothetical protein